MLSFHICKWFVNIVAITWCNDIIFKPEFSHYSGYKTTYIHMFTDAMWRMLLYAYFILNCGLYNFNLYIDAAWFNPLDSGYVICASRNKWYLSFVVFYPITAGSDICEYNLLFSPTRLWCIHIEEKCTAFGKWGSEAWYIRYHKRICEEYIERTESVLEKQDIIFALNFIYWFSVNLFISWQLCGEYHNIVQSNLNILFLVSL